MSYCRFSSDNFRSDVYVYEDCLGGWTTHVAGNRLRFGLPPEMPYISFGAYFKGRELAYPTRLHAAAASVYYHVFALYNRWIRGPFHKFRKPIGLPFGGETFNHGTPGECADWLLHLRGLGYRVPQRAIDALYEEEKNS